LYKEISTRLLATSIPLTASNVLSNLQVNGVLLLAPFLLSKQMVSYVSISFSVSRLLLKFTEPLAVVLYPAISSSAESSQPSYLYFRAVRVCFMLTLPVLILMLATLPPFVSIALGLPRFRGQVSGRHGCECTGVDGLLLVVDRAEVADR